MASVSPQVEPSEYLLPHNFVQERKYLKNVSDKTLAWYKDSFRAFEGALESEAHLKKRIVELGQRGVKAVSINTWLRCVKAYYLWQGKPWTLERLKEESKILSTFSAVQIKQFMSYRPRGANLTRAWNVAVILIDTGLRISECLGLRPEDVDLDQMTLRVVGKGNKHRLVPLSQEGRKRMFIHLRGHHGQYVFGTGVDTKLLVRNFLRDFKKLCKSAGIEGVRASPHTLRHSFAVHYLRNGGNLEFLRRILGHSSILTTQKYLRSLGVEDLQAVHNGLSMLSARR